MFNRNRWFPWIAIMMILIAVVDVVGAIRQTPSRWGSSCHAV